MKDEYYQRYKIKLKNPNEAAGIRAAGRLVLDTLDLRRTQGDPGGGADISNSGGEPYIQNAQKMLQIHLQNLTEITNTSEIGP